MKIEFQSNIPAYRKTGGQPASKSEPSFADRLGKTDVIEICRGQSALPDDGLSSLKGSILQDVTASAGPARLEELQEKIKSGAYHPSTEELIDAILAD